MSLPLPETLSPSKITAFKNCALAFRFSAIDRFPSEPTLATAKGTLVHRVLERLFMLPPEQRTQPEAFIQLEAAWPEIIGSEEHACLAMDKEAEEKMWAEALILIENYFKLEDPREINAIGLELKVSQNFYGVHMRGIIDRLDLDEDGELIINDYKTGNKPSEKYESSSLVGLQFYSFICEKMFGKRPKAVRLIYLKSPPIILENIPTEQSTKGFERTVKAVWDSIERSCAKNDFRPKKSYLCNFCDFKPFCPEFGGTIPEFRENLVVQELPLIDKTDQSE